MTEPGAAALRFGFGSSGIAATVVTLARFPPDPDFAAWAFCFEAFGALG